MPVDKENLRKGIEALRDYPLQAFESLRRKTPQGVEMCALGVLCDVSGLGVWKGDSYHIKGTDDWSVSGMLPVAVAEFYGFDGLDPVVDYGGVPEEVTRLNDEEQLPLDEIADLLEATYLRGGDG